jgi:hypothetical protein
MIQPETTRVSDADYGKPSTGVSPKSFKKWVSSNFMLNIKVPTRKNVLDGAKVMEVPAITVRRAADAAAVLAVPDLTVVVAPSGATRLAEWFSDSVLNGDNRPEADGTGTLQFLDSTLKTALFTLTLSGLGITQLREERRTNGVESAARVRAQLYCETMSLEISAEAIGASVNDAARTPNNDEVTDTVASIISGRLRGQDALRAALRIADAPVLGDSAAGARGHDADLVARRLLATIRRPEAAAFNSERSKGTAVGTRWAAEHATLEELQQLAALQTAEWSAITLGEEHSLIAQLRDAGIMARASDGGLDLERDDFVEGLVAGASDVLRAATPRLSSTRPTTP